LRCLLGTGGDRRGAAPKHVAFVRRAAIPIQTEGAAGAVRGARRRNNMGRRDLVGRVAAASQVAAMGRGAARARVTRLGASRVVVARAGRRLDQRDVVLVRFAAVEFDP